MPTPATLERFIARVEENAHVQACEEFYTQDSSMQENLAAPRIGRDAHVANERAQNRSLQDASDLFWSTATRS
jgi:hypothetical protein